MTIPHTFHIPVMGSGFTIDTALKVSQFGIDSALSLVDDVLIEKMRKHYCNKYGYTYNEISDKVHDRRAERITAYLNLINEIAKKNFFEVREAVINNSVNAREYFSMMPCDSAIRKEGERKIKDGANGTTAFRKWVCENIFMGSIDVNIMTKLDRQNYENNICLPAEFKDAHAAVRGFAKSDLNSSLVLSAGLSPELYGYLPEFDDFFPDENGNLKKKIIVKVSDYRSALTQGKFLAKKGVWISEYRVESGLNCGGHTFATEGELMGPILEEFKNKKEELIAAVKEIYLLSLKEHGRIIPVTCPAVKLSAQGGIGSPEEHSFILNYYKLDSIGWGTPFLLVPDVVNVDDHTLKILMDAGENDVYLSNTSPLQIPFYSLKGNTRDIEKEKRIESGMPGTKCPRKYLAFNKEFSEKGLCLASFEYQRHKIKELGAKDLSPEEYSNEYRKITEKSCICVGLGTSVLINKEIDSTSEGPGVSVCPSPNIAYFNRKVSLKEMIDHIYGRINLIENKDRPNVFIKEMYIYIDFLKGLISETGPGATKKQLKFLHGFTLNLNSGLQYYYSLFEGISVFRNEMQSIVQSLNDAKNLLTKLSEEVYKKTGKLAVV